MRELIEKYNDNVVLFVSGHYHPGGRIFDNGIVYWTLDSVLEAPIGENAFATLDFYENQIKVHGHGIVKNISINV